MRIILVVAFGFLMGFLHRLYVSPFIGNLKRNTQSVATPTAGVILAFPSFLISFLLLLKMLPNSARDNDGIVALIAAYSYIGTFLGYGGAVVLTISAKIGGVKN